MIIKDKDSEIKFKLDTGSTVTVSSHDGGIEVIYAYKDVETYKNYYYIHEAKKKPGIFMNSESKSLK